MSAGDDTTLIAVPALLGAPFREAMQALEAAGLRVAVHGEGASPRGDGTVVSQLPFPGTYCERGWLVDVWVQRT